MFVSNISASMHWKGLWALFSYHGKVVDTFISEKKSKGGMRFGFVRYANYSNARRAISILNGFVILGSRIWVKVGRFKERLVLAERITWVEISGVPMHCWNYETFKRIAGKWGNLVSMGENLSGANNFEKVEMLISISQVKRIDEMVFLEVGDVRFLVSVRELGWSEDFKNKVSKKVSNQVVVDESVSESKSMFGLEPKKGLDSTESSRRNQ
ncbi:hypothetical protein J1N35_028226 [Gossypium stocksii]|uniref:RRM domain-containing protein n=1 Tax=Gossypium stocksii TaxID=47602 RepID=A0A9D3UWA7_9ROSI|nr:hypothetical protein J1N35_028226 [Gossypium stocksii]